VISEGGTASSALYLYLARVGKPTMTTFFLAMLARFYARSLAS
jgi:hypothetical protein